MSSTSGGRQEEEDRLHVLPEVAAPPAKPPRAGAAVLVDQQHVHVLHRGFSVVAVVDPLHDLPAGQRLGARGFRAARQGQQGERQGGEPGLPAGDPALDGLLQGIPPTRCAAHCAAERRSRQSALRTSVHPRMQAGRKRSMRRAGLAAALATAIAVGCAGTRAMEEDRAYQLGLARVDRLDVKVMRRPVTVHLNVYGTLPDSCTEIEGSEQQRLGSSFDVTIATRRESRSGCVAASRPFEKRILLEVTNLTDGRLLRERERRAGELPDHGGPRRAARSVPLPDPATDRASDQRAGGRLPRDGRCNPRASRGTAARTRSGPARCWGGACRAARRRAARGGAARASSSTSPCVMTARFPGVAAASARTRAQARSTRWWNASQLSPPGGA